VSDQAAEWLAASVLPPLGALRTAPATARGHVRDTLAAWRLSELSDTVELVVGLPPMRSMRPPARTGVRPISTGGYP
jgi:hypothetical protein